MAWLEGEGYLRPMMVPMLHTKGMTAYAFATFCQHLLIFSIVCELLTFMLGVLDELANHGLNDSNVSVQYTTKDPACKCHPEAG